MPGTDSLPSWHDFPSCIKLLASKGIHVVTGRFVQDGGPVSDVVPWQFLGFLNQNPQFCFVFSHVWPRNLTDPDSNFNFNLEGNMNHVTKTRWWSNNGLVMPAYGRESWTVKKAERRRIDAFELWCWRRLLRVPWAARKSKQSILKEISPECSLEGLMLKLKLQYFGHLKRRADSLENTHAGKDWRKEEKGMTEDEMVGWHHWLNGHEFG